MLDTYLLLTIFINDVYLKKTKILWKLKTFVKSSS